MLSHNIVTAFRYLVVHVIYVIERLTAVLLGYDSHVVHVPCISNLQDLLLKYTMYTSHLQANVDGGQCTMQNHYITNPYLGLLVLEP